MSNANVRKSTRLSMKAQKFDSVNSRISRRSSRNESREEGVSLSSGMSRNSRLNPVRNILDNTITSDDDSDEASTSSSSQDSVKTVRKNISVQSSPRKHKSSDQSSIDIGPSTPPKQKKFNKNSESLSDVENEVLSPKTPSGLLSRLSLTSPKYKSESRKSLFSSNIYHNAKRALHSTTPGCMPGREAEFEELEHFMVEHLEEKKSGSLYISGPPGTGKTASLTLILEKKNIISNFKPVYVNCTSIKSSGAVFSRIIKELGLKGTAKNERDYLNIIEKYFSRTKNMNLLVLDEMDQLESKNQSVLYTIFEWPSKFKQNIVLIGIANALDLTDRILPRLQARCELKPKLVHFSPYSKEQILGIITSRLEEADALKVFSPAALQILAGKVAAVSGDVRRALDIARRVIELIEKGTKEDILQSIENVDIDSSKEEIKIVNLKEVVGVLNNVYGTTQNLSEDCDSGFPLQQKIVICCLLLMLQKAKNKDITIGKLHEIYKRVCGKRNLFSVDQAEFVSLCSLIETKGILRVSGKKEPRLHKVTLQWDQEEVINVLKDKILISSILQDDSVIGKL